jgi:tRNA threonylcarbamoyladenosine biosynthesis protein TsaE
MKKYLKVISQSPEETKAIGKAFALSASKDFLNNQALVICIWGDLGSGKTTFVLGFLRYFGIKPHAASPTFVILKRYFSKKESFNIYHLDAYRLHSKKDLDILGFDEIINNPKNIVLIEWPQKIKARFKNSVKISFSFGKKENERIIYFYK